VGRTARRPEVRWPVPRHCPSPLREVGEILERWAVGPGAAETGGRQRLLRFCPGGCEKVGRVAGTPRGQSRIQTVWTSTPRVQWRLDGTGPVRRPELLCRPRTLWASRSEDDLALRHSAGVSGAPVGPLPWNESSGSGVPFGRRAATGNQDRRLPATQSPPAAPYAGAFS
jgi:hypothetical protein